MPGSSSSGGRSSTSSLCADAAASSFIVTVDSAEVRVPVKVCKLCRCRTCDDTPFKHPHPEDLVVWSINGIAIVPWLRGDALKPSGQYCRACFNVFSFGFADEAPNLGAYQKLIAQQPTQHHEFLACRDGLKWFIGSQAGFGRLRITNHSDHPIRSWSCERLLCL